MKQRKQIQTVLNYEGKMQHFINLYESAINSQELSIGNPYQAYEDNKDIWIINITATIDGFSFLHDSIAFYRRRDLSRFMNPEYREKIKGGKYLRGKLWAIMNPKSKEAE